MNKLVYYNAETGAAAVGTFEESGPSIQKSVTLTPGWTHLVAVNPYKATQVRSERDAVLVLQRPDGRRCGRGHQRCVRAQRMKSYPNGTLPAGDEGWTHVTSTDETIASYNARTRAGSLAHVDWKATTRSRNRSQPRSFSVGWTHLVGLQRALYFYNAGARAAAIAELR